MHNSTTRLILAWCRGPKKWSRNMNGNSNNSSRIVPGRTKNSKRMTGWTSMRAIRDRLWDVIEVKMSVIPRALWIVIGSHKIKKVSLLDQFWMLEIMTIILMTSGIRHKIFAMMVLSEMVWIALWMGPETIITGMWELVQHSSKIRGQQLMLLHRISTISLDTCFTSSLRYLRFSISLFAKSLSLLDHSFASLVTLSKPSLLKSRK